MQVNIHDARARLSALLDRAVAGEDIVITRSGKPLVCLTRIASVASKSGVRLGGLKHSGLKVSADFHALLTTDKLLGEDPPHARGGVHAQGKAYS